jgi:hypothetical protein
MKCGKVLLIQSMKTDLNPVEDVLSLEEFGNRIKPGNVNTCGSLAEICLGALRSSKFRRLDVSLVIERKSHLEKRWIPDVSKPQVSPLRSRRRRKLRSG